MHKHPSLVILLLPLIAACSSRAAAPRDPGSPTPVAAPGPGVATTPSGRPEQRETGDEDDSRVPVRPEQAPLVQVRDALELTSLLGRRVRVAGRCTAVGGGRTAGSWTLEDNGSAIEVRGRVPASCARPDGEVLTIFAQVEPAAAPGRDRLLLRLPD